MARKRKEVPNDSEEENISDSEEPTPRLSTYIRTKHQIGSIVRVNLKNFVTYDSVEFYPGPNLNMIIGPNGTGKSTIVCAIALGLGWNTPLLGRAREISEFVKHGQDRASIEIELKSMRTNVIIMRVIKKANNASLWKLNGEHVSLKEINNKVNSLNIQVDNLCQFLPQDKVSEFAQLSPPELLVQTQKAVGEKEMTEWHEKLITLRDEEKSLSSRNDILERDVMRFREREAILRRIELYELKIPFERYYAAKKKYDEAKQQRAEFHLHYQRLLKENKPMNDKKSQLEAITKDTFNKKKSCSESFSRKKRQMEDTSNKLDKLGNDCDDVRRNLNSMKKKEKQRENQIAQLRTEITRLEELTSVQPEENDTSAIRNQLEELSIHMRNIQTDGNDINAKQEEFAHEERQIQSQISYINERRQELEDKKKRRLESLRYEHHTLEAVQWLRQNNDKLVARVFDPICVEINVKDVRYADAIETTFVCESDEDYHTITKELCDVRKLKINVVCFSHKTMNDFPPPMHHDQLRRFGFDCYLLDQIEAPMTLLTALCNLSNLNKIPVALQDGNINHREIERTRLFFRYFVGDTSYSVSWSRYGQRLSQSLTTRIKSATILKDSINIEQKRVLEQQYQELQASLTRINNSRNEFIKEEEKLRVTYEKLREKKNILNEQKRQLQQVTRDYQRNKIILEEEDELREKLYEVAKKRARVVGNFQNLLEESMGFFSKRNEATLKYIQASSDLIALEAQTQQIDDALKRAQVEYKEAEKKFSHAKAEAKRLWEECNSNNIQNETMHEINELCKDMTLEELEDAVTSERAKAEMHYAIDPRVIDLYNKRKADIESLKSKLAVKANRLSRLNNEMTVIKEKWEPKLIELIEKISGTFSDAFDRIGCAGEVRISTHEDYEKWGIDILVKFRDNEKLQILTAQRQSGGERSVSTIMYLMALQELAKAPFRVVDEINQGMDPRNERLILLNYAKTITESGISQANEDIMYL
ncbi:11308_t:CDS:10 [Funneliformis caledonium]|uniref:Structural maintenance of chromosomes protein 5 n=1 Tax=Funneliformis caledonium TaxID=1117310 RepID=A0A9N9DJE0_9GLOM|nr:11308_t:CDS:10 [Funneliformis caledonium]